MKNLLQKAFGISVLVILATSFYDFGPLWFYIFVLLPFFVFAAYSVIIGDFTKQTYRHSSSSSTMHRTPLSSGAAYSSHKNYVGIGCYSGSVASIKSLSNI